MPHHVVHHSSGHMPSGRVGKASHVCPRDGSFSTQDVVSLKRRQHACNVAGGLRCGPTPVHRTPHRPLVLLRVPIVVGTQELCVDLVEHALVFSHLAVYPKSTQGLVKWAARVLVRQRCQLSMEGDQSERSSWGSTAALRARTACALC